VLVGRRHAGKQRLTAFQSGEYNAVHAPLTFVLTWAKAGSNPAAVDFKVLRMVGMKWLR
jgi:hypothetical protein